MDDPLPPKIRAKAAKKTYFIKVVAGVLKGVSASPFGEFTIKSQLIADILGLMCGTDCTADDVRKAR